MKATQTDKAPKAIGPYSQAMTSGGFLFTSGQIPLVPETGEVAGDTIEEQARQSIDNIAGILAANGIGFEKVVKTTCYLADMNDFAVFNNIYSEFFISNPARSCVAVKTLPKNVRCEIEAIAELV